MGWIGFGTFQGPTDALVMKSRWLLKIKVVQYCAGWGLSGNQSASSGNYWKPPISCHEQSSAACNRVDLSITLHCIALYSVQQGWLEYCITLHCTVCNRVDLIIVLHCIAHCATGLTWAIEHCIALNNVQQGWPEYDPIINWRPSHSLAEKCKQLIRPRLIQEWERKCVLER